jgi:hypothetical protein
MAVRSSLEKQVSGSAGIQIVKVKGMDESCIRTIAMRSGDDDRLDSRKRDFNGVVERKKEKKTKGVMGGDAEIKMRRMDEIGYDDRCDG